VAIIKLLKADEKAKIMNMSNMPIARRLELFSNKDEVDDADSVG